MSRLLLALLPAGCSAAAADDLPPSCNGSPPRTTVAGNLETARTCSDVDE